MNNNYKVVIEIELGEDTAKILIKNGLQICYIATQPISEARKILGLLKRNSVARLAEKFCLRQPNR